MRNLKKLFDCKLKKGEKYSGVIYNGSKISGSVVLKWISISDEELKLDIVRNFILFKRHLIVEITNINLRNASCNLKIGNKEFKDSSFIIKGEEILKVMYEDGNITKFFTISRREEKLIIERTVSNNYVKVVVDIKTESQVTHLQ